MTVSGVKQNLWRRQQGGLYAPARRNFPLNGLVFYLPLWEPSQTSLLNGTGIATGAPMTLTGPGTLTITVTQAGTFLIYLPTGATGTATAGTMAVTNSPVSLVGGLNTITTTGATGNFTIVVPTIISKDLNARLCTVIGATWGYQGRTFDGIDDYINCTNNAVFDITANLTIIIWIKTAVTNKTNRPLDKNGVYAFQILGSDNGGSGGIRLLGATAISTESTSIADGTWKHITGQIDADKRLYINGTLDKNNVGSGGVIAVNTTQLWVGARAESGPGVSEELTGSVGEVLIYNRILTLLEIQQHYLSTKWRYQ